MQVGEGQLAAAGSAAQSKHFTTWSSGWGDRERTGGPASRGNEAPFVYVRTETGRRASYLRVMERLFGARRARLRDLLLSRAPVLFMAIEETFFLYALVCLVRSLTGRRTAGLLLRPMPLANSRGLRCRCKHMMLRAMKRFRAVRTMTIVPFDVFPAFAEIADGWIYDFQLWDITEAERKAVEQLRSERRPTGRLTLTAIGTQSRIKGFDLFVDAYARFSVLRQRFTFLSCGVIAPDLAEHALVLGEAGGVAVDRVVSDAELLGAYAASDAIWCLYPRAGDHACGILGRAAQLGIPVVVRQGSLAHRLCAVENLVHIAVATDKLVERLAGPVPPHDEACGRLAARRFATVSEIALRDALGLAAGPVAVEG